LRLESLQPSARPHVGGTFRAYRTLSRCASIGLVLLLELTFCTLRAASKAARVRPEQKRFEDNELLARRSPLWCSQTSRLTVPITAQANLKISQRSLFFLCSH
jgi:hypothetical protein